MSQSQQDRAAQPALHGLSPPPKHPSFAYADGVRGIAAFLVIAVHTWLFTGGFGGFENTLANRAIVRLDTVVAIFFLLSAFLLYRPMIAHRAGGPASPRVKDYARRRLLRIYPPLWIALTVLAIIPGIYGVFTSHWWEFYSLATYLDPLYNSDVCPAARPFECGLPQTWTLTVEMTFYLILPFYAMLTARIARGRELRSWVRIELVLLALLAVLSVSLDVILRYEPWFRFTFAGHFYWIGLGLAMALISAVYPERGSLPRPLRDLADRPGVSWAIALCIYLFTVYAFPAIPFIVAAEAGPQFLALHILHGLIALFVMIPVAFSDSRKGMLRRVLGNRVVIWFGMISYGLYLWHLTIAYELGTGGASASYGEVFGITLLIAIPLSALSWYLVEKPLMSYKPKSRRRRATASETKSPGPEGP